MSHAKRLASALSLAALSLSTACADDAADAPAGAAGDAGSAGHGGGVHGAGGGGGGGAGTGGVAIGGPGCGLPSAAFCETFDAPSSIPGRSNELDSRRWSLSRLEPSALGTIWPIGPASIPACRAGVSSPVLPPDDTRICDAQSSVPSPHLLVAVAAQNYGSNAYRIRQPFDFSGRTGTIVFDVDAAVTSGLYGWISVEVTEDPMNSPGFSLYPNAGNFEGTIIPRNGVEVQLTNCPANPDAAKVLTVHEYRNYVDYVHDLSSANATCFSTSREHLNRFELRLSQTQLELWATPFSTNGVAFEAPSLVASADLDLGFSRGYVHITTHNHATLKYSEGAVDAWVVRWDNVGFDGPVIGGSVEYEAPDSLVSSADGVGIGYLVHDVGDASKTSITIPEVDLAGATSARLSFSMDYLQNQFGNADFSAYALQYRLNGHAWHVEPLNDGEKGLLESGVVLEGDAAGQANSLIQGVIGHVIDLPLAELASGDNVLEIATDGVPPSGYPSTIANVDLVVAK